MAAAFIDFRIFGLAGEDIVLEPLRLQPGETVARLKELIHTLRPGSYPRWQRLFSGARELQDAELVDGLREEDVSPVVLQCIFVVDPWDLLREPEISYSAAQSLDRMSPEAAARHLERLFEDGEGELLPPTARADVLWQLRRSLEPPTSALAKALELPRLKAACFPHVLDVMSSGAMAPPDPGGMTNFRQPTMRQKRAPDLCRLCEWLGSGAVPRLVAWLGLLERPLSPALRYSVEQVQKHESARVRLAAKSALRDTGCSSVARVQELAALRAALGRNAATALAEDRRQEASIIKGLRDDTSKALSKLRDIASDRHVRYAASRALKL